MFAAAIALLEMKSFGYVPDEIKITRYRWFAGGRNSKRYRNCLVIEASGSIGVTSAEAGDLLHMEIERPSMQHLAGYVR